MSEARCHRGALATDRLATKWRTRLRRGPLFGFGGAESDGSPLPIDFLAKIQLTDSKHLAIEVELLDVAAAAASEVPPLTSRERGIVALIAEGLGTRDIAERLYISPATVRTHVRNAMSKLKVHTRAQLVAVVLAGLTALEQEKEGEW